LISRFVGYSIHAKHGSVAPGGPKKMQLFLDEDEQKMLRIALRAWAITLADIASLDYDAEKHLRIGKRLLERLEGEGKAAE
jgi:hypothetical protein